MSLSRDQFLSCRKLSISKPIRLSGRADDVYVRELTGAERAEMDQRRWIVKADGSQSLDIPHDSANWVVACLCDSDGKRLLGWGDLDAVKTLPAVELDLIATDAREVNRLDRAAVEDDAKN